CADGLDLWHDQIGLVLFDGGAQFIAIEPREYLALVRDLHRRGRRISVTSDDIGTKALGRNSDFAAQFARTQQQDFFRKGHELVISAVLLARHVQLIWRSLAPQSPQNVFPAQAGIAL